MSESKHAKGLRTGDLMEDLFGLNIMGFQTIGTALFQPAKLFAAARTPDWNGAYTPSIRLVFSILTLLGLFSFIWAGENSTLFQALSEGFTLRAEETGTKDLSEGVPRTVVAWYSASLPFVLLLSHSVFSQILRVWGKGTDGVTRIRLHMAAIVPSMLVTVLSTIATPFAGSWTAVLSIGTIALVFVLDASTAFRGGVKAQTQARRIAKAILFGMGTQLASFMSIAISFIVIAVAIGFKMALTGEL